MRELRLGSFLDVEDGPLGCVVKIVEPFTVPDK